MGEQVDDVLWEIVALLVLGGLGLLAWWGWGHSRTGTIGVGVALAPLLLYGLLTGYRWWIAEMRPVDGRRLALGIVATVVVVAGWLTYVVVARPH